MIAFAAASLLAVQPPAEPPAPADMEAAFGAWTHCLGAQIRLADRATSARRVADAALAACRGAQDEMLAAHDRWVASSTLSAREKAEARRSMARSMREIRGNVVRIVREERRD